MRKLIVANYKMNGNCEFFAEVQKKVNDLKVKDTNLVLCPPFVYLNKLNKLNKQIALGVQDVSNEINTKSTGQISPNMIKEFGAKYAIVGHSERRANGETDELVSQKVAVCVDNDLIPIICVGEKTKNSSISVLKKQVQSALSKIKCGKVIFAYEPVWAIGSGEIPTNENINKASGIIKSTAKKCGFDVDMLYGGSVNEKNCVELLKSEIDGFLLGGVSLKIDAYLKLVSEVENA